MSAEMSSRLSDAISKAPPGTDIGELNRVAWNLVDVEFEGMHYTELTKKRTERLVYMLEDLIENNA